jgi:prolyl oligopeptidase
VPSSSLVPVRRPALVAALVALTAGAVLAQAPAVPPAAAPASASEPPPPMTVPAATALKAPPASGLHYPAAEHRPVQHTYHGVTVTDDFEWLEKGDDPATKTWVAAQNQLSRSWLDAVPGRAALHERLSALVNSTSNSYHDLVERGGWVFALKNQPPKQQPLLVRLKSVDDVASEQVVFDPNAVAANGSLAIDFYTPSLDGRRVALSVSENGSEDGTLRVIDVASGQDLGDRVPRAAYPTAGGSVAWAAGNGGFYYTRMPAPGERAEADIHFYQQIWYHALGTPSEQDRYEAGKDFPRIAETALQTSRDGTISTAIVENGDGREYTLYVRGDQGWRVLAQAADGIKAVKIGDDDALYLLSQKDAPKGKVLRLPKAAFDKGQSVDWSRVEVVSKEGGGSVTDFALAGDKLYIAGIAGGPSILMAVDLKSHGVTNVKLPPISSVAELAEVGAGQVVAEIASYTTPTAWMHVAAGQAPRRSALFVTSAANFDDCEVVREFATSRDGTKVPLNILHRKGTRLDGRNPTILYGYGGYGVNMEPAFRAAVRPWLDRGGIYVVANIRGGGEYGDAGTWRATSRTSRTCSTTSSRRPNTSSSAATRRRNASASTAAATAAC